MTTPNLELDLIRDEGIKVKAYKDSRGYWTIGVGHLLEGDPQSMAQLKHLILDGISREQVDALFAHDRANVEHQLDLHLPWWRTLDDLRQDVLANMTFNMGVGTLLQFKNTLAAIKAHDWPKAAAGMLASEWCRQVGQRAGRLATQMKTGEHQP